MKKSKPQKPQAVSRFVITVKHDPKHDPGELAQALSVTLGMGLVNNGTLVPQFGELDISDVEQERTIKPFARDHQTDTKIRKYLYGLCDDYPSWTVPKRKELRIIGVLFRRGLVERKVEDRIPAYRATRAGREAYYTLEGAT